MCVCQQAVDRCLLFPVSEVRLVVDVVLCDKDDPLVPGLRVHKLGVLEILLAVHPLDILLLTTNLYQRWEPGSKKTLFLFCLRSKLLVNSFLLYEKKYWHKRGSRYSELWYNSVSVNISSLNKSKIIDVFLFETD